MKKEDFHIGLESNGIGKMPMNVALPGSSLEAYGFRIFRKR
ncbi:MAG: hypothetical protein ACR2MG_18965 [Pyrinomonadaceae bacterium]